jgi:aminobenzoyl-glutamate utilization protein B
MAKEGAMSKRLGTIIIAWTLCILGPVQASSPARQAALSQTQGLEEQTRQLSMDLWEYSEIALREERSVELLGNFLESEGFDVRRSVAGMPTAFVASWGSGSPRIGILAEYDALPGVGNAAKPERSTREDGVTSGQGCGHNLFGAASTTAAVAIKRTMQEQDIEGTIVLYGTPAEETVVGKVFMAREGLFDDMDAVLDWHPSDETKTRNDPGQAMNSFTVEFFGQAAHGAYDPWNGRSALDGVELLNYGVNMMREHIEPTARIHYVIPEGGDAPNVVPEYAKVWYYVRDLNRDSVEGYYQRILKVAEGAALATGTTHEVTLITGVHECLMNRPIQEAIQANLELAGDAGFTPDDQAFGKKLQRFLEIEEAGFVGEVQPLEDEIEPATGGSTDVCEVSYIVPQAGFSIATAAKAVPWHSWATTACHGTEAGVRGAQAAARVLALTGIDLLTDTELLAAARRDFQERTRGESYQSPIPAELEPPLPTTP